MTITKIFSYISAIAMTVVIFWAQSQVPILESPIPDLPWGTVSWLTYIQDLSLYVFGFSTKRKQLMQ